MRSRTTRLPWIASLAVAFLVLLWPDFSRAQPEPEATQAPAPSYDPPARVGRLARISGTVSFRTLDQDHWEPASLNYPITSGNALWTEPGATARVEVAGSRLVLDQQTELDIDTIDDHAIALTERQGATYLRLGDMPAGDSVVVRTPRGTVTITSPGQYEIVAGDIDDPTIVTVIAGVARITGDNLSISVPENQAATLAGTDTFTGTVAVEATDDFLRAQLAAEAPPPRDRIAPPVEIGQMTGAESLVTAGEWETTPDYGEVWYPPVASGWVPYREGNWAYVAPWGWTWIDAAPWGFAPFHYGRWFVLGSRWCWTPEHGRRFGRMGFPVFAPALVRWFDVPARGGFGAAVGWVPLGPRERFTPWYRSSQAYARAVNRTDVTIVNNFNNFANHSGATVAPVAVVTASERIAPRILADPPISLAGAQPVLTPRLSPNWATAGVTPEVARQLHLDPFSPGIRRPGRQLVPAIHAACTTDGSGQHPAGIARRRQRSNAAGHAAVGRPGS